MFSKEEAKKLRKRFWTSFGKYSKLWRDQKGVSDKWILYNTKVHDLSFKFDLDNKYARVCIDFEMRDQEVRGWYFEKWETMKTMLNNEVPAHLYWTKDYPLDSGKDIHRIYCEIDGVSIYNTQSWQKVFDFFSKNMLAIEYFYTENKDYLSEI